MELFDFRRARRCVKSRDAVLISLLAALVFASVPGCNGLPLQLPSLRSPDGGFFGWHFYAPFDTTEVKTVFVYFKSQSFRRDLQLRLTEEVQKEISMRTPYRVVGNSKDADSILSGVITADNKNLVVEAPTNLPRGLNASINVSVTWTHNPPTDEERSRGPTLVSETINFIPEVGETTLGAFNHVIQSLAKQIVDMMEQPWFTEKDVE